MTDIDLNPYEELGVSRDADRETVQAAFRAEVKKHHPDRPGGDEAVFQRKKIAADILLDEARRAEYDKTGKATRTEPNNDDGDAMQAIIAAIMIVIKKTEPRRVLEVDLIGAAKADLQRLVKEAAMTIHRVTLDIEIYGKLISRIKYKGPHADFITACFTRHIEGAREARKEAEKILFIHKRALEMIEDYSMTFDGPASPFEQGSIGWERKPLGISFGSWGGGT